MNLKHIVIGALTAAATATVVAGCTVDGTPVAGDTASQTTTAAPSSSDDFDGGDSVGDTSTAAVPPPANATTMTCRDYTALAQPVQVAVVTANGVTKNPDLVASLVGIACLTHPDATIASVISNMPDDIVHN